MPGSRCVTFRKPPHMLTREPRCGTTGPEAAWTGTLPISSPRISRAPPGSPHRLPALPGGHGRQAGLTHRPIPTAGAGGRRGGHGPRPEGEREPPICIVRVKGDLWPAIAHNGSFWAIGTAALSREAYRSAVVDNGG